MEELKHGPPLPKELMFKRLADEGVTVEESPAEKSYPKKLNQAGFEDLSPSNWDDFIALAESCRNFLIGPIILDSFATHGDRRTWRNEADRKYGKSFSDLENRNKLRLNNLANVALGVRAAVNALDRKNINTPQADAVRELSKQLPDLTKYRNMPLEKKREAVRALETVAHGFLNMISQQ